MKKFLPAIGLVFLLFGIAVLIFADGLRRYYSGGFFLVLAGVVFLQLRRRRKDHMASIESPNTDTMERRPE